MPADVRVSAEDQICTSGEWNNGAGPMWCYGASTIVREGDAVFASVNEVDPDATPLCNTRMRLYRRPDGGGWERMYADDGLEREPCLLVRAAGGGVVASTNPSIGARGEADEGGVHLWRGQETAGGDREDDLCVVGHPDLGRQYPVPLAAGRGGDALRDFKPHEQADRRERNG